MVVLCSVPSPRPMANLLCLSLAENSLQGNSAAGGWEKGCHSRCCPSDCNEPWLCAWYPGGAGVDKGAEIPPLQPCRFAVGHGGRRSPTARVHVPPAGAGGMHVPAGISTCSGSWLTGFIPKSAFSDPRKSRRRNSHPIRSSDWSLSSKDRWCLWPFSPGLSGLNLLSRHRRPCGSNSVRMDG